MRTKPIKQKQKHLVYPDLLDQLNPKDPLLALGRCIPWERFEEEFAELYSSVGRPAKPVRLMVGLMILKQLENLSDERVIEAWVRNPYYQAFCGEQHFQWKFPCDPTDLVYFRKRIGEDGVKLIFEVSVGLHGDAAKECEITVDTTVQEKNITFPTDVKLLTKVILGCRKIAKKAGIQLRRSFRRELPRLLRQRNQTRKTIKRIKTMAGVLVRELERKLPADVLAAHRDQLDLYLRVQTQKRSDKNKIYSLHEPGVLCIGKGKAHKKYEFGAKASIAWTRTTGVIVGAKSFATNVFDGHTLPEVLDQVEAITGKRPEIAICDRGYRGRKKIGGTEILLPSRPKKTDTAYQRRKARMRFRRRAGIEPVISHVKHDYRMARNYLKGAIGDAINLFMAAAAFNFRKWIRALDHIFVSTILLLLKMVWTPRQTVLAS